MIRVCGPRFKARVGAKVIDTPSHSTDLGRSLSPFMLGPVGLYDGYVAVRFENAWQYAKVYRKHADENGDPTQEYWAWAKAGWSNPRAVRYPMGKGAIPLYSYWDGRKLSYIDARKTIYVPLYTRLVTATGVLKELKEIETQHGELWLWDFDGYEHGALGITLDDVLNCETRKMGHAFVLAMLLQ